MPQAITMPRVGASVHWGHPHTQGLVGAYLLTGEGNAIWEAVRGRQLPYAGSAAPARDGRLWGGGVIFGGNTYFLSSYWPILPSYPEFSIVAGIRWDAAGTGYNCIWGETGAGLYVYQNYLKYYANNSSLITVPTGRPVVVGYAQAHPGTRGARYFIDGTFVASSAVSAISAPTTAPVGVGGFGAYNYNGAIAFVYVYTRCLSDRLMADLAARPFAMFESIGPALAARMGGIPGSFQILINGIDRTEYFDLPTLRIRRTLGNASLSGDLIDKSAPAIGPGGYLLGYRPLIDESVEVTDTSGRRFLGMVLLPEGSDFANHATTRLEAIGHQAIPSYCYIDLTLAAGSTLREVFDLIVAAKLGAFSITRHASMLAGPTMPAIEWDHVRVDAALSELIGYAGPTWVWDITEQLELWGFEPAASGVVIEPNDGKIRGPAPVERPIRDNYADKIILECGDGEQEWYTETFLDTDFVPDTGSPSLGVGYTTVFESADLGSTQPIAVTLWNGGVPYYYSFGAGTGWTWDWSTHTLWYNQFDPAGSPPLPPLPTGDYYELMYTRIRRFTVEYDGGLPPPAALGAYRELILQAPTVIDPAGGLAMAETLWTQRHITGVELDFETLEDLAPGTTVPIHVQMPGLELDATFLVQETERRFFQARDQLLEPLSVIAIEGTIAVPTNTSHPPGMAAAK